MILYGVGGSDEGLWILVVVGDEAVDGGLEIDDGMKLAAFQPPFRQLGEKALDGIQPGGRSQRELEVEPWMALQPRLVLSMYVGRVVVGDEMDIPIFWGLAIDLIKDADEFLVPVALYTLADDFACQYVQGRKQCGRSNALVVVGHGGASSFSSDSIASSTARTRVSATV